MSHPVWMIYGANGYTGRLAVARALDVGARPILAGRNEREIRAQAEAANLQWRSFALDRQQDIVAGLRGVEAVLHCAGPFSRTAIPMFDACLRSRTHYLDITGEIGVFESLHARSAEAVREEIVGIPGVGFDVVPTDCLAAMLASELPDAHWLELAFAGGAGFSPGTLKTSLESLHLGGRVRRDGKIIHVENARFRRTVDFADRPREVVSIPWGDVSTAYWSTGIQNITVYTRLPQQTLKMMRKAALLGRLSRFGVVRRLLDAWVSRNVKGPDAQARTSARTHVWGEVRNRAGQTISGCLEGPEGYELTAHAAVASVTRVLARTVAPGVWTPSRAFGANFVTELAGVTCKIGTLRAQPSASANTSVR